MIIVGQFGTGQFSNGQFGTRKFTEIVLPTNWNKTLLFIYFNIVKHFRQYIEQIKFWCVCVTTETFFGDNFDEIYPNKIAVPNCPFYNVGAKLSIFTMLVPNCLFHYLGAKMSFLPSCCQIIRFTILVPNCSVPNCPVAKLSYHPNDHRGLLCAGLTLNFDLESCSTL